MSFKLYIISDSEMRYEEILEDESLPSIIRQKKITYEDGPLQTHFTYEEILELASIIVHCKHLRTRYEHELDLIAWCIASQNVDPPRIVIVTAIRILLARWMKECLDTESCIPSPSIDLLNDAAVRKILIAYHNLKSSKITL